MRSKIDDIDRRQDFIDAMRDRDAQFLEFARHQCARPDQRDARAEFEQRENVRARHAAEKNVAEDRDVQAGNLAAAFANGESIEQRLRRMFVRAVAGVDDARSQTFREKMRRAGGAVAQDNEIGVSASRIFAVSLSVSPFVRLEVLAEMLITSALKRVAASSNEVRVRVLGSTKKLTSVLPRKAGTFFTSRVPTCLNASAVSSTKCNFIRR